MNEEGVEYLFTLIKIKNLTLKLCFLRNQFEWIRYWLDLQSTIPKFDLKLNG